MLQVGYRQRKFQQYVGKTIFKSCILDRSLYIFLQLYSCSNIYFLILNLMFFSDFVFSTSVSNALLQSPFEKGNEEGYGNPWCWEGEWTYERCCQQDFAGLTCETKRKGEEGGCVDCAKSVTWKCLTPAEKRLEDAIEKYNKGTQNTTNTEHIV